jgi:hypothetical protein
MATAGMIETALAKMAVVYGAKFDALWKGHELPALAAAWAEELKHFDLDDIGYAMQHLPDGMPPNLLQFKALCRGRLQTSLNGYREPRPTPEQLAPTVDALKALSVALHAQHGDPKGWARRLKARELAREPLSGHQKRLWRAALGEQ